MIAIIQARLGSTRLPNKVLERIGDKTMIEHCIDRVKQLPVDKIVVAVSNAYDDFDIWECIRHNCKDVDYFRLNYINKNDLLKRYIMAGIAYGADYILRVCSDMPFFSIPVAKDLIMHKKEIWYNQINKDPMLIEYDYIAHYLEGEDTPTVWKYAGKYLEVVRLSALFDVWNRLKKVKGKIDYVKGQVGKVDCFKEHPTSGIYLTPQRYKIKRIMIKEVPENIAIDTQEDLDNVRKLYREGIIS